MITRTVWQLVGILRATFEEVGKRPHPTKLYRRLSSLPGLGAIAGYLGERDALNRSTRHGVEWLTEFTGDGDIPRAAVGRTPEQIGQQIAPP